MKSEAMFNLEVIFLFLLAFVMFWLKEYIAMAVLILATRTERGK